MTPDHAEFAEWDAAYVLGALTPADRSRYEGHLDECDRCRAACAELAALPGLLAAARPVADGAGAADAADPPRDLVPAITDRRRRRRREVRARVGVALAAAAVVAGAVVIPLVIAQQPSPAATFALTPVDETAMTATVSLTPVGWGTRIEMECGYPAGYGAGDAGPWSYALVVTDDSGESSQVSTWNAIPGQTFRFVAATAVAFKDIASIEVRSAGGEPLLVAALE
jgi:anti-sigma factor RsiW